MRRLSISALTLVLAAALSGCGSSKEGSASSNAASLTAANTSFSPTDLSLKAGKAEISVKNSDSIKHNLTVEGLKVNKDLDPGASATATFTAKAGTYQFHCEYHPQQMKGTITVGS